MLINLDATTFLPISSTFACRQEHLKRKSREAAKCRRGQQNDEYSELASQLPLGDRESSQLDRLSVMRLTNSFIKIKHFLNSVSNHGNFVYHLFCKG